MEIWKDEPLIDGVTVDEAHVEPAAEPKKKQVSKDFTPKMAKELVKSAKGEPKPRVLGAAEEWTEETCMRGVASLTRAAAAAVGGQADLGRRMCRPKSVIFAWASGQRRPELLEEARIAHYARQKDPALVAKYIKFLKATVEVAVTVIEADETGRDWEPRKYQTYLPPPEKVAEAKAKRTRKIRKKHET